MKKKAKFILFQKYYTYTTFAKFCQGIVILRLSIFKFKIDWFTDNEDWFLYLYFGKLYFRFSSAGFIKGVSK